MKETGMVIIGAGEAGGRAAVELRAQGWSRSITIIGEERWAPYERPPLSKRQLLSDDELTPVYLHGHDIYTQHDIRLISGNAAVRIDRKSHKVILADRTQIGYERLLLTTGARPRQLSCKGSAAANLLYLRTFADAVHLRSRLAPGKRVAIIGGGFIGLEVAATAIERGCSVIVIEVAPRILIRGVPEEIARMVEARHREAGVEFKIGIGIESIDHRDGDESTNNIDMQGTIDISLADGTFLHCDEVIVGIGAIPETKLAAECGLEIENGVRVDERLVTSDPDIFAAGDCCSFPHPLYGGRRIRLEAYRNAQDQGIHAAQSMMGAPEPFETAPWFWSDHYELTLQIAGLPDSGQLTIKRSNGESSNLYFHLSADGTLVAVSGIGLSSSISKDIRLGEMLIQQQAKLKPDVLTDPNVKLKSLLQR
jgi:3-phenylpropionate/trans-cinnamate dioxygenase ferredoxin reductase subunit